MRDIRLQHHNKIVNGFLFNGGFSLIDSGAKLSKQRRWPHKCLSNPALTQIQTDSTQGVPATSFPVSAGSPPPPSLSALCFPPNMTHFGPQTHSSSPHARSLRSHVSPSGSKSTLRQRRKPLLAVQMSKRFSNPVQFLASIISLATSSLG